MTTELEKQFYQCFGIEPKIICSLPPKNRDEFCRKYIRCPECIKKTDKYPQITDRHYLELICMVNERRILPNLDVDGLKEYILKELSTMIISENFKHQVQRLFKE